MVIHDVAKYACWGTLNLDLHCFNNRHSSIYVFIETIARSIVSHSIFKNLDHVSTINGQIRLNHKLLQMFYSVAIYSNVYFLISQLIPVLHRATVKK